MSATIEFIFLDGQKQEFSVTKESVIIGRGANCDIVIPFDGISRMHAQLDFIDGEVFVTDLGSTNGILIDGAKITPKTKTPYQTFLNLQFGPFQSVIVHLKREATSFINISALDAISKKGSSEVTSKLDTPAAAPKTRSAVRTRVKEEKNQSNFGVSILIVLMIAGVAIYFQFFRERAPEVTMKVEKPKEVAPALESSFKTKEQILSLVPNFNCREAMAEVCQQLALNPENGEGALADGVNLLALINMNPMEARPASKEFTDLISTDRYEVALLEVLQKSSAISLIYKNPTFTNLQLIGFLDKEHNPLLNLKMNSDIKRKFLDPLVIGSLLDDARSLGNLSTLEAIRPEYKLKDY